MSETQPPIETNSPNSSDESIAGSENVGITDSSSEETAEIEAIVDSKEPADKYLIAKGSKKSKVKGLHTTLVLEARKQVQENERRRRNKFVNFFRRNHLLTILRIIQIPGLGSPDMPHAIVAKDELETAIEERKAIEGILREEAKDKSADFDAREMEEEYASGTEELRIKRRALRRSAGVSRFSINRGDRDAARIMRARERGGEILEERARQKRISAEKGRRRKLKSRSKLSPELSELVASTFDREHIETHQPSFPGSMFSTIEGPIKREGNRFFVEGEIPEYYVEYDKMHKYWDLKPFFENVVLSSGVPASYDTNRGVVPWAWELGGPPEGIENQRFLNGEKATKGDSGLFGLCAASAETTQRQTELYRLLAENIVRIHKASYADSISRKSDKILLLEWLKAQTSDSLSVFQYYDLDPETLLLRPFRERLVQIEDQHMGSFQSIWANRLTELSSALANDQLENEHIRWIEFLSHSVNVSKIMQEIQSKSRPTDTSMRPIEIDIPIGPRDIEQDDGIEISPSDENDTHTDEVEPSSSIDSERGTNRPRAGRFFNNIKSQIAQLVDIGKDLTIESAKIYADELLHAHKRGEEISLDQALQLAKELSVDPVAIGEALAKTGAKRTGDGSIIDKLLDMASAKLEEKRRQNRESTNSPADNNPEDNPDTHLPPATDF